MTVIVRLVIFLMIICISGIASAQDTDKGKDRAGRDLAAKQRQRRAAKMPNKQLLGQLELTDEQKKSIGQIVRESRAEMQKLRQELTGMLQDPETASARRKLVKQLKEEGKTKQEIKDAISDQFAGQEKPQLDKDAKNELMKSLQEFRIKTTDKIKTILTDQQRVTFEQLIQEGRNDRAQGNPKKRKGNKKRGKDGRGQKNDGGSEKNGGGDFEN